LPISELVLHGVYGQKFWKIITFTETELAQIEYEELLAERKAKKHEKNTNFAREIVDRILDFADNITHFNHITDKKIPLKTISEWRELFALGASINEKSKEFSSILADREVEGLVS
jgi:hypothetical protein